MTYTREAREFLAWLELKRRSKTNVKPIEHTGAICTNEGTCATINASYNFLAYQKQLWLYSKGEDKTLSNAICHRIYYLEKKIFVTKEEMEEINTLTIILKRLGYGLSEELAKRFSGEWAKAKHSEFFYRVKKEKVT